MTTSWRRGEPRKDDSKLREEEDMVLAKIKANPNCTHDDLCQWIDLPAYKIGAAAGRLERGARISISKFGRITRYNLY